MSIGLAGCGAGIAGLINLSLVLRWAGAGGLLVPTGLCKTEDTQAAVNSWPHVGQRGGPTIKESRGEGACIDDSPENHTIN